MNSSHSISKPTSCPDPPTNPAALEPGVLRTELEDEGRTLRVDYDPRLLSDESAGKLAQRLVSDSGVASGKCLMQLRGRACEACALNFERKAEKIEGIRRARATFIGGVMSVSFDQAQLSPEQVVERVQETGAPVTQFTIPATQPKGFREKLQSWLHSDGFEITLAVLALIFLIGGWLGERLGMSLVGSNTLYLFAYLTGGYFGVQAGIQSLRERTIDVDLLMVLAALGAALVGAPFEGAMLLFLFSLSNVLQSYAIDRTRKAIDSLMKLRPDKALTRRGGETALLPIEQLIIGDIVLVRPGERIPLDSEIIEGESALDQSSLTGESMPVSKRPGDSVFAGTINQTGGLEVRVTKLAKDSTIEKLIRMVEEAQTEKAETQRFLDRAEQYYAMGVIGFTLALILGPQLFALEPFRETFYRAMTVMVVASPCALIISTPASILSAIGAGARRGVLFKGGAHLERTAAVKVIALDKTGTLTEGKPRVTDVVLEGQVLEFGSGVGEEGLHLLQVAAAIEVKSEHPLAQAIVTAAGERDLALENCIDFQSVSGMGARGTIGKRQIAVGNLRYFEALKMDLCERTLAVVERLQDAGKTCVLVAEIDGARAQILGAIAIADVLRQDAAAVVDELRGLGMKKVVMLTGDNRRVAAAIAKQAGVDEFHADLLPEDKVLAIKELAQLGPVAMVGDGVNDAPALATASVGIAMGAAGTDVAMETADVVLMSDNLRNIPFAIALSSQAHRVIWQNLVFSVAVIIVLVISALGFALPLPVGVIGHEGSTVLVCLNGLRLLAFRGTAIPAA